MTDDYVPPLNEHGLFVHWGAQRAIEAFLDKGRVGLYPMYLVGLALPEHRCGPAVAALLTMSDGGVIDAHARSLHPEPARRRWLRRGPQPRQRVIGVLGYDVWYLTGDELDEYRRVFYEDYGGFALPCLERSPTAAAESMLMSASLGLRLARQVGPSPQGPPNTFPSDWTDVVYYSQDAIGCTVEGFTPSTDALVRLDVPDPLKRAMQLSQSADLDWLSLWRDELVTKVHPRVPELVTEAWAIRIASPRASVALLRSVAELVAQSLGASDGHSFFTKLAGLEERWANEPSDQSPAGRRENAWRAGVLSCFHTVRDVGNRIHADSVVDSADALLAHNSNKRLLEAVLRAGPLDDGGRHDP